MPRVYNIRPKREYGDSIVATRLSKKWYERCVVSKQVDYYTKVKSIKGQRESCASSYVVGCQICNREVAGSNLGLGYYTKVYSAFHPSGVGKWVPAAARNAKAGMAHSACGWNTGRAGKTVIPWQCGIPERLRDVS